MSKKRIKFHILCLLGVLLYSPVLMSAAELGISPSAITRTVGSTFTASVYVSSKSSANAVSGVVSFPANLLEVASISKANSVVNLWVQEPSFSNSKGTVTFEGIMLNPGFIGTNGTVLSITFRTKLPGSTTLRLSSGSLLANDGLGTNMLATLKSANVAIQPIVVEIPTDSDLITPTKTPTPTPTQPAQSSTDENPAIPEIPVITYYASEVISGTTFDIRGQANPGVDVEITLTQSNTFEQIKKVRTTAVGDFTAVLGPISDIGTYTFTVRAIDEAGNTSKESPPFMLIVKEKWLTSFINTVLSYVSVALLVGFALAGVVIIFMFMWYRSRRLIKCMRRETREAEQVSEKAFKILHKDIQNHVLRLKRIDRKLTEEETDFLEQFDVTLEEAREVIGKEIRDIAN